MVISHNFKDILDEISKTPVISLPTYKESGLKIEFENSDEIPTVFKDKSPILPFARSDVYNANISSWRRLTADDDRCKAVYELTFDIKGINFNFKAGDTIGILPQNNSVEVNTVLNHLSLLPQAELSYRVSVEAGVKGAKIPPHIPAQSSLRHVLTHCVDLRGVLKKLFILALSKHTKCDIERKTLQYLCSKEGSAAYMTHILNRNLCVIDIFSIFKSCKPPIEVMLANLPRLLPRPYSVVNSGLKNSNTLKICFSVLNSMENRKGLTTGWLEELILNETLENRMNCLSIDKDISFKVPMYLRQNIAEFCMPENINTPLILIATGTGVAPFISFLEEREKRKEEFSKIGDVWLFFGCRNPKLDYLYEEELKHYLGNKCLSNITTSFSRINNDEAKYVQHSILEYGQEIVKLIECGAYIFICGEAKTMVRQVKENLVKSLMEHGSKSQEEAEVCIAQMEKDKRYLVDLWT